MMLMLHLCGERMTRFTSSKDRIIGNLIQKRILQWMNHILDQSPTGMEYQTILMLPCSITMETRTSLKTASIIGLMRTHLLWIRMELPTQGTLVIGGLVVGGMIVLVG